MIKILPLNALMPRERLLLFSVQTAAYQLYEAMLNAEKTAKKNADDQLVIDQSSNLLLDIVAESHFKAVEENLAKLLNEWAANNNSQFPS